MFSNNLVVANRVMSRNACHKCERAHVDRRGIESTVAGEAPRCFLHWKQPCMFRIQPDFMDLSGPFVNLRGGLPSAVTCCPRKRLLVLKEPLSNCI